MLTEASTWVKLYHPKKTVVGVPLWEDMIEMFTEGETRLLGGREEEHHPPEWEGM